MANPNRFAPAIRNRRAYTNACMGPAMSAKELDESRGGLVYTITEADGSTRIATSLRDADTAKAAGLQVTGSLSEADKAAKAAAATPQATVGFTLTWSR